MRHLLMITLLLAMHSNISAQKLENEDIRKIPKIIVSGTAEMEVEPDEIYMTFSLKEYSEKNNDIIGIEKIQKSFINSCSKAGILKENIAVQQMGGNTYNSWWIRKRKKDPGFKAVISYEIKFRRTDEIDALMPLLDEKAVTNVYMSKMDHSKMEEFKKEVRIKALKAALDKANYLAKSIDHEVGEVLLITEIDQSNYPYVNYRMQANMVMDAGAAASDESSVPFKKITIKQRINAEFELK